jgi:hypothetical protein
MKRYTNYPYLAMDADGNAHLFGWRPDREEYLWERTLRSDEHEGVGRPPRWLRTCQLWKAQAGYDQSNFDFNDRTWRLVEDLSKRDN